MAFDVFGKFFSLISTDSLWAFSRCFSSKQLWIVSNGGDKESNCLFNHWTEHVPMNPIQWIACELLKIKIQKFHANECWKFSFSINSNGREYIDARQKWYSQEKVEHFHLDELENVLWTISVVGFVANCFDCIGIFLLLVNHRTSLWIQEIFSHFHLVYAATWFSLVNSKRAVIFWFSTSRISKIAAKKEEDRLSDVNKYLNNEYAIIHWKK